MIADVVPLVTQPMINYLRGRNGHSNGSPNGLG
jgi:hypothetical protein